jgi:hypothetical protein
MSTDTSDDFPNHEGESLFGISPEFIEENRKIDLVRPSKRFAPFTKAERQKRRKEVYRLHFEMGIPGLKIADMMHVDKNTIYDDIRLLYKELARDDDPQFHDYYNKQTARLELQRARLFEYLNEAKDVETKIAVERLIAGIDFKLLSVAHKLEFDSFMFWDKVKNMFNQVAEEKKLDYRVITLFKLYKISEKSGRKLDDLMKQCGIKL